MTNQEQVSGEAVTDHQGLTDEQFRKYIAGLCFRQPYTQEDLDAMVEEAMPIIQRQIDHHTTKAKEDERRRIDGLVEQLRVLENAGEAMAIARRMELSERLRNEPLARDGLLDEWNEARNALRPDTPPQEAATQSTPKGSES